METGREKLLRIGFQRDVSRLRIDCGDVGGHAERDVQPFALADGVLVDSGVAADDLPAVEKAARAGGETAEFPGFLRVPVADLDAYALPRLIHAFLENQLKKPDDSCKV